MGVTAFAKYFGIAFVAPARMIQAVRGIKMFFSADRNVHRVLTIARLKMFGQFISLIKLKHILINYGKTDNLKILSKFYLKPNRIYKFGFC